MLAGTDKFFCNECSSLQEAQKRMRFKKLPKILVVHLKRFKYIESQMGHVKLLHRNPFPLELKIPNTVSFLLLLLLLSSSFFFLSLIDC